MLRRLLNWLDRKTAKEQLQYAGAEYALALSHSDYRRADRLKRIIDDLKTKCDS